MAFDLEPRSVSTIPRPIESSPMRANGPTGISPPNSSAIIVRTHGMGSARADHAGRHVRRGVEHVGDLARLLRDLAQHVVAVQPLAPGEEPDLALRGGAGHEVLLCP